MTLGGAPLAVASATAETIVAELPASLDPGSLLLTVALPQGNQSDRFALAIPATDIVTPADKLHPLDPDGRPMQLNPYSGAVTLDPGSPLNPLPVDEDPIP